MKKEILVTIIQQRRMSLLPHSASIFQALSVRPSKFSNSIMLKCPSIEERRTRKLLLHKKEIRELENSVAKEGKTLVPLKMYFKKNKVKVLLGLCQGNNSIMLKCPSIDEFLSLR